jgi:S1-C subfamily serine protease
MNLTIKFIKKYVYEIIIVSGAILILVSIIYLANTFRSAYQESTKITVDTDILADGRLSYKYLKDVTVRIKGEAIMEEMLFGFIPIGEVKGGWLGTGIIIKIEDNVTYILTNAHVSGKGTTDPSIFVAEDEHWRRLEIVTQHKILDLAILKYNGILEEKRVIKGFAIPEIQEKAFMVGHSLGDPYIYSEGVFAGYYEEFYLFQMPTMPGNSGSGVFNNKGELVGLIFAGRGINMFQMDVEYGIAIDSLSVKLFLEKEGLI